MSDLVPGLDESLGKFVTAWLLPSLLATAYAASVLAPAYTDYAADYTDAGELAILGLVALTLAFVLASACTMLTRVLEGYYLWPPALRRWAEARHLRKRAKLEARVQQASGPQRAAIREKLNSYPRGDGRVLGTALGNALRAGESYGWVQYGFSIPDLWVHLSAAAPDRVNEALDHSRSVLDFFVAAVWLSAALAAGTAGALVVSGDLALLWWLGGLVALVPFWYARALAAVHWYRLAMWALADLGRVGLAETWGLRLPGSIEAEREVWRAVSNYTVWGPEWEHSDAWVATIDGATVPRGAEASGGAEAGGSGGAEAEGSSGAEAEGSSGADGLDGGRGAAADGSGAPAAPAASKGMGERGRASGLVGERARARRWSRRRPRP